MSGYNMPVETTNADIPGFLDRSDPDDYPESTKKPYRRCEGCEAKLPKLIMGSCCPSCARQTVRELCSAAVNLGDDSLYAEAWEVAIQIEDVTKEMREAQ